jgi:phytoene dehydrogenase-like protein
MASVDYVIVGGGINGLVAASMLGKKGRKVLLLERSDRVGGCLRTEEITAPGFVHDVMATTLVLFLTSPAYGAIGKDLEARGFKVANSDLPTGVLRPDGSHVLFSRNRDRNVATFEACAKGDGETFAQEMNRVGADAPFLFALLGGRLWSRQTATLLAREAWKRGPRELAAWFGEALRPARHYLESTYASEGIHALWAPWGLHCGLNPESAYSAQMIKVIAFAIEMAGCPIAVGGAKTLVGAFERLIADNGGRIQCGADVDRVETAGANGPARAVLLTSGERIEASQGIICSMTPTQLYGRLLRDHPAAAKAREPLKRYRYGKGDMQVHYALSAPPRWKGGGDLGKVALLHVTPGLDGVSRAANECERGVLPAEPTICVGQPTALDSSRAPEGKAALWLQLPEAPRHIKGDAKGEIAAPADGRWTPEIREAYADRVEALFSRHIENFSSLVIARKAYSPADLEALNINLVGGDPYGGYCGLDQFFLWRPFSGSTNHNTPVPGLYQIGASTHPGPGLGGGSGFLLADALK